ncbi:MAG: hypothetical protein H8E66_10455 [Planctomycetes bacterium]|nr:hypothetical protein [Planctomycetota bacterium]
MRAIGFRAEPSGVFWAVVEGTRKKPILVENGKIVLPTAYESVSDQLAFIRQRVVDTIERTSVDVGAIRFPESNRRSSGTKGDDFRLRMEGVLMESFAAANIPLNVAGAIKTIGRYIGTQAVKDYLTSDDLRGLKWPRKDAKVRESIMVATAALGE